jgi:hypothetical protein
MIVWSVGAPSTTPVPTLAQVDRQSGSDPQLTEEPVAQASRKNERKFEVTVTAHVTGDAYGTFFAPDGTPFERVVPFALDINNVASGVSALPIDYIPPVVTVGGRERGTGCDVRARFGEAH